MVNVLNNLRGRLVAISVVRARFLADTLDLLSKIGLDVEDPEVRKSLDLTLVLIDGKKLVTGLRTSTVVITIVN